MTFAIARKPAPESTQRGARDAAPRAPASRPTSTAAFAPPDIQRTPSCACGGGCPTCAAPGLQPKLTISQPGDRYEREADRVAEQVMRMAEPASAVAVAGSAPDTGVQRCQGGELCGPCSRGECSHSGAEEPSKLLQRQLEEPEEDEEELLQAKASPGQAPTVTPRLQAGVQAMRGGGQPLPATTRAFFEPRFGADFSNVRVHTGAAAVATARDAHARAFTLGRDVVFAPGQYAPETTAGRRLLAHELTHVVQQRGANTPSLQRLGDPTQMPAGLRCPPATDSPGFVDTNVLFPIASSTLSTTAVADIASLIARWKAEGFNKVVRVDGFASTDGPEPLNWRLSCDRAETVENELLTPSSGGPGIPTLFIDVFAQGETSEFSTELVPNRRSTISLGLPRQPIFASVCTVPGVSRTLDLQPVFLRTSPTDKKPTTGKSWTKQFNEANAIWGKVGVTFVELPAVTIDTPLKTASPLSVRTTFGEVFRALRKKAGVEVFLVDDPLAFFGGGTAAMGMAPGCGFDANIVISDSGTDDTLLAHELGHILGILHPDDRPQGGRAPGDPESIMKDTKPFSRRNTMVNFDAILCPPPSGPRCLFPDPPTATSRRPTASPTR